VFGLALVFFATGLLVQAIAEGFASLVGPAWGDAITAGILLVPALFWALVVSLSRRRPAPRPSSGILRALFAVVAKDTPWVAVLGAGLAGLAATIAKLLLIVFVVLLIVSAFSGALRGRPPV
jgi:uncharacterized membrane protein YtjA (UPF0391 family)